MKNLLLWLALSAFFSSCNYYSVYVKKQAENFEEAGMKRYEKAEDRFGKKTEQELQIVYK
jgi:hypothetical protein